MTGVVVGSQPPGGDRLEERAPVGARLWWRWRLALRLGWRDVTRHKTRSVLVVVMIALATAILGFGAATIARVLTPGARVALSSVAFDSSAYEPEATTTIDDATLGVLIVAGALGLVQSLVLIAPAFLISLRRRTRELGMLTAVGARDSDLSRVVVGPALVSAVIGVGIGGPIALALGVAAAGEATPGEVVSATLAVAGVMALNTALAVVAAWAPARATLRGSTIAALTGRPEAVASGTRRVVWSATLGVVAVAVGVPLAVWGAHRVAPAPMVGGVVLAEAGILLVLGALLRGIGHLPARGVVAAYVLRDASRAGTRVLPAVAAGTIIVAAVTAGLAYSATMHAEEAERGYLRVAPIGSVFVLTDGAPNASERLRNSAEQLGAIRAITPVMAAQLPAGGPGPDPVIGPSGTGPNAVMGSMLIMNGPLIATADLVDALDLGQDAASAVAAGKVLLAQGEPLNADGTVHLTVADHAIDAPAQVVPALGHYTRVALSAEAAALGLAPTDVGVIITPTVPLGEDDRPRVTAALGTQSLLETGPPAFGDDQTGYLLVGFGALAVLVVTAVMSALAAQETRTDRATLDAVGAAPRTLRRIAGAQAGLIATAAAWTGVPAGFALATLLLVAQHSQTSLAAGTPLATTAPTGPVLALLVGLPVAVAFLGALTAPTTAPDGAAARG